jgi:hypothetical protein
MEGTPLIEERERLQKALMEIFQKQVQTLNPEFQSILIDDIITAFYSRLTFLKKIQHSKEIQKDRNNSSVLEPKWLTDDIKKIFKYEVGISKDGLRVTKLRPKEG